MAVPSEELRTVLWMFVIISKANLNFETVLHVQKDQWRGPAKFGGIPKTWNHLDIPLKFEDHKILIQTVNKTFTDRFFHTKPPLDTFFSHTPIIPSPLQSIHSPTKSDF